ncbi:hypothetical protein [Bacillus cereus]
MSEWLVWMLVAVYYLVWDIKDWLKYLPLKLYVKWILWRDNMIDKIRRKIR